MDYVPIQITGERLTALEIWDSDLSGTDNEMERCTHVDGVQLGSEDSLARRVEHERLLRNWSPAGLARLVTKAGAPMNQSAIWKIENGNPRRKITVDEALAFAAVFEVPLEELLLPVELAEEKELRRLLEQWRARWQAVAEAQRDLEDAEDALAEHLAQHPDHAGVALDILGEDFGPSPEALIDQINKAAT